jgi:hypothetical protein
VLYHLNHSTSLFFVFGIFVIGSLKLFASVGLKPMIFLISASLAARLTGMSQQHQACFGFFEIRSCSTVQAGLELTCLPNAGISGMLHHSHCMKNFDKQKFGERILARRWWLTPVILATW